TKQLTLLEQNLIEVSLNGSFEKNEAHLVELRRLAEPESVYQSFQMLGERESDDDTSRLNRFTIVFGVNEDVALYVPGYSNTPVAEIKVKRLPVPRVKLSANNPLEDPWPDDRPLSLN